MANNVQATAGSGTTFKTTDTAGVHVGHVNVDTIAAGDNNIGNVDIASIAAGDNNIGNVDVASIAAGDNNIGNVDVVTVGGQTPAFGAGVVGATVQRVVLASDTVNANGRAAEASSAPVAVSDEDFAVLQAIDAQTQVRFVTVSMSTPTDALDAGDVAAATQVVAACTPANDVAAILQSLTVIDTDDQKAILRFVFFSANTALGTEDVAPDIDDTELLTVLGHVDVAVADYVDYGGGSVAAIKNIGMAVLPATGTDDIYMAIYTPQTSTPTYASGVLTVRLGFI